MARVPTEPFLPFTTERLLLRTFTASDVPTLVAYRDDPEVARLQDWALPYTEANAYAFLERQAGLVGPTAGRHLQIAVVHDGQLVGDLAVGLDESGKVATLGYSFRVERQGRGFATEAAGAVVDRLFDEIGVHRITATLDPENDASARVLERLGFRYEGRATAAAPVRGEWLDDDCYALLAADRAAWLNRPRTPPTEVRLVHVVPDNLAAVAAVSLQHSQERFAPTTRDALVEVLVPPVVDGVELSLRARAIEADGAVVGLVVITDATAANPDADLRWIVVDRWHQRRGIGSAAITQVLELELEDGQPGISARWPAGRHGPGRFFDAVGFVPVTTTDGVVEGRLSAVPGAAAGRADT